ncbi:DUF4347 domain-containing protein [Pseudomonas sp. abacavir_1]
MAFWKRNKTGGKPTSHAHRASLIQALEPRMMFDASVPVVADQAAQAVEAAGQHDVAGKDTAAAPASAATATEARHEVVFVDGNVQDYKQLTSQLPKGSEVVVLDPSKNGLQQMADYLKGRTDLDAIHLISHGGEASVQVGSTRLTLDNVDTAKAQLEQIGASLGADGDLLIYGCDVGKGADGSALLAKLAGYTDADVAASTDWSGDADKGGDWVLEAATGAIESKSVLAGVSYDHVLNTLNAGDMVVLGWNALTDTVTLATLVDIPAGTVIKFTDKGWDQASDAFTTSSTGDGTVTWTTTGTIAAGTRLQLFFGGSDQATTLTNVTTGIDLSSQISVTPYTITDPLNLAGDGLFIYQDTDSNPYFIFGFNNSAGAVDANGWNTSIAVTLRDSMLPDGVNSQNALSNGINAVGIPGGGSLELDNIQYTGPTTSADRATWLARVTNSANWTGDNSGSIATSVGSVVSLNTAPDLLSVVFTDSNLNAGETSGVTFMFNTAVTGFTTADLTVPNGVISGLSSSDGGVTWSGILTPNTGVTDASNVITVNLGGVNAVQGGLAGSGTKDSGNYAIDTLVPSVNSVSSSTANGVYKAGDVISIQVSFNEAVTVTGTPQLTLETGATDRAVSYVSGSGTSTLTFNYTVQAGDSSADLDYLASNALSLNGGSIRDAAGNDATLTLASPGTAGSLGANKAIVINSAPSLGNLNGDSVAWAGVGSSVTLDVGGNATLSDTEFGARNAGSGDWSGASLTVQRPGAAVSTDSFDFNTSDASFTVSGNNLQAGGLTFATFTNSGGVLTITYTSSGTAATTALVNDVARHITYRNDTPSGDTSIRFTLSDGSSSASADVVASSDFIYVTNATDTATIDPGNGVSFSEAVAIAAADATGSQTIVFSGALAGQTINLAGNLSIGESLTLDTDAASGLLITGGTISLGGGTTLTLSNGAGDTVTLGSALAGSGALSKTGSGTLGLTSASNEAGMSGGINVAGGTLQISSDDQLSSGTLTLNGGTLSNNGASFTVDNAVVLGGAGGTLAISGGTATLAGVVSGGGSLTKTGSGTAMLAGSNTYTGDTMVAGGTLALSGGNAIADVSSVTVNSGASLSLSSNETLAALAGAGAVQLGSNTLTVGGANLSTTFAGSINGSGSLAKTGTGTFTLSGSSGYTGATSVQGGTLMLNGSLAGSSLSVLSGATLGGTGTATLAGAVVIASGGTLSPGNGGAGTLSINGNLIMNSGSVLQAEINGSAPGSYDQVLVNGLVFLSSAATLSVSHGYPAGLGDSYAVIVNDGSDAISGTFSGLAEGSTVLAAGNGTELTVSYVGGTGNDFILAGPVNQAPVIDNLGSGPVSHTEGGAAVLLDAAGSATVSDSDSSDFNGGNLTVSITANRATGEDLLGILDQGTGTGQIGVSGNSVTYGGVVIGTFAGGSGSDDLVVTFTSANATAQAVQALIHAITYRNSNLNDPSTATRTLSLTVNDGDGATSSAANLTLNVVGVNDPPSLTATGSAPTYVENGSAVSLFGDVVISAGESGQSITGIGLSVSGLRDGGNEILRIDGTDVALVNGNALTTTNGMSVTVSVSGSTASVTVGKAGGISTSDAQNLVAGLSYRVLGDTPGAGSRVVTLTHIQDSGGTTNGGIDTTNLAVASSVNVVAVNDAPQITAPLAYSSNEDTSLALSGISFSDVDAGSGTMSVTFSVPSGALFALGGAGVTVSGTGSGQLTLGGSLADLNAFIAGNNLTYMPAANFNGSVQLTIGIDDGGNGGSGPADALSALANVSLTINAVNDAPTVSVPGAQSVSSLGSLTFSDANGNAIVVSDVDNADSGFLLSVSVSHGSILYSGMPSQTWSTAGPLSGLNAFLNGLVYQPTSGYQGSDTLVVTVTDGSGGTTTTSVALQVRIPNPQAQDVVALTPNGTYKAGDTIQLQVTFDQNVFVDGTPGLLLETGLVDRVASYSGGSGSNVLTFLYTVQAGDVSADLDVAATSALQLNGGSIKNAGGDVATLTLAAPGAAGSLGANANIVVDGVVPLIGNVSVPSDGIYRAGQNLDFTLNLSEAAIVDGTPRLAVDIGGQTYYADYLSGTGSSALVFRLGVPSGQLDSNGISIGSVDLNGGGIHDIAGNAANLTLNNVGATSGVLVDSVAPSASGIVRVDASPSNGTSVRYTVTFSEAVSGVDASDFVLVGSQTASGVVSSVSTVDSRTYSVVVSAVAGTGTLRLDLANDNSIKDQAGNALSGGLQGETYAIDHSAPQVSLVLGPGDGTYKAGDILVFSVSTNEAVQVSTQGGIPRLAFVMGSETVYADYVAGSGGTQLEFQYLVQAGDNDADGITITSLQANGGSLKDSAGNDALLTLNNILPSQNVRVDTLAPVVSSVDVPADGTYKAGDLLSFTVNASETVTVNGSPRLALTIGSSTVYADYVSGSGTSTLVFQYQVQAGDNDADGITVGSIDANGGTLRDGAGNNSVLTLNSVGNTAGVLVDTSAPVVTGVGVPANGHYNAGDVLNFTVNASEAVFVNGSPRLALTIGSSTVYADYVSGSGTGALVFQYQVQAGDTDADGITVVGLQGNGATLRDNAGNDANLALSNVGSTAGVIVDTSAPLIVSVDVPADGSYRAGTELTFTVNASEAVLVDTGNGTPRLALDLDGRTIYADYLSGSGSTALTFRYQVQPGDNDADGIQVLHLESNGGALHDAAGNALQLTLDGVGSTQGVLLDTTGPTVTLATGPYAGYYKAGDALNFSITGSENLLVDTSGGAPLLLVELGGRTVYADFVASTGSGISFRYLVQPGDNDAGGIRILSLQANGSTITDAAGNPLDSTLTALSDTSGAVVDTTAPGVTSVAVYHDGIYKAGDSLMLMVGYSENILLDTSNGTPRLVLDIGGRTVYADFIGNFSSYGMFSYRIQPGDNDADGIQVVGLESHGAVMRDQAGNDVQLTLHGVRDSSAVLVDTTAPTVTSITRVDASPSNADTLEYDVSFSERVAFLGAQDLALQASGSAHGQILSVVQLNDLTWRVSVGEVGGDGTLTLSVRANAVARDAAGNALATGLTGPSYALDHSNPQITAVQLPADGRYTPGQTLEFSVDFSEAVQVDTHSGVPRIAITLDRGGVVYADYVSGSGSSRLVFAYTVQSGQADIDGIQLGDQILANGARLSDAVGNAANLALGSLPSTSGLLVQGSLSDGDPQFRAEQGIQPALPGSIPGGSVPPPPMSQNLGAPTLGQAPLLDSSNRGAAQSLLGSLFREGPSQTQIAQIFANAGNSAFGDGSGHGFLGFGGGDAGVFGSTTLGAIFGAAREGDEQALSAFGPRQGDLGQGLRGIFTSSGFGQQLQEMNQREQRQVADLANAFGELGQERPAS